MEIKFENRKETNTLVIWNIAIPRIDMNVKSVLFRVLDYDWYLVFQVRMLNARELWNITLRFSNDEKNCPCFPLIAYVRHKGKDLYLSAREINDRSTEIWRCYCNDFRQKYPTIEVNGTYLQFVFDFHLRKPDPIISITEDKSIQTSKVETKYQENPCLEDLSLDLSKLIEDGTDTDVLVKCGEVSMGAHKVILCARSEVFRTMMQSDMVEGREGIIEISDMGPKILKIFIKYIYTGILPELPVDTVLPIYEAADKYQIEALKKRSGQLLVKNLSPENALAILVAADAHSDTDLKDQLVSYISEEKIPSRKKEWLNFCNEYPKLATEVLNYMFLQ